MSTSIELVGGSGGTSKTVLMNQDGSVQYPSVIPPGVDVPPTPSDGKPFPASLPKESTGGSHYSTTSGSNHGGDARPALNRKWDTERPQARADSIPAFTRAGTDVGNWKRSREQDEETPSSSSEDEIESHKQRNRFRRKKNTPKQPNFRRFDTNNEHFRTKGKVSKKDGRLNISVNETGNTGYLAKALGANFIRHVAPSPATNIGTDPPSSSAKLAQERSRKHSNASTATSVVDPPRPKMNIVVMVIGSRGDIQPFLRLGKILKEEHGHRVRIATHPAFRDFVQKDSGLEFFSVGGDPAELMAFMVKNPGMIPKMETLKAGEVGRRRDQMAEMFEGLWRACINATDTEHDSKNLKMMGQPTPFVADAIIANPPCFAHVHCAERLGIPLHLMFTFPYTPTQQFPHPLANIKQSNVDPGYSNFMSYPLVDMMTWQGLGDLINIFRERTLGLEPVSTLWAPGQLYRLHVPYTYLWSPGLIPKPADWGPEIDVAGFVFLDLASSFEPPKELEDFLAAGDPPIYIGFGSIVVDDPDKFTKMIFEAVEKAGARALVSKGWGGLGDDNVPDNIFMLENTPHDWLFPKVKAVVHHGGAGTNAIGLKCGKPTMIVPFFGDQQFWGVMVADAGAGPEPVPYKDLTTDKLAEGLKALLSDKCVEGAAKIAEGIEAEGDGAQNAVKSFHRSLTLRGDNSLRCTILEDRVAVWVLKGTRLRLSALAATILVQQRKITWKQLRLIRHCEWNDFQGPGEPISGAATAVMGSLTSAASGIGGIPFRITKHSKKRQKHEEKKRRLSEHTRTSTDVPDTSAEPSEGNRVNKDASQNESDGATDKTNSAKDDNILQGGPESTAKQDSHGKPNNLKGTKKASETGKKAEGDSKGNQKEKEQEEEQDDSDALSTLSEDPEENAATELAKDIGLGLGRTGEAIARIPMDLTMAIAQGFHNAPRLYGDTTVRRTRRVTGYKSGLKAAGEEFGYGVYDGVTGLVTQPYIHARDDGPLGFVKGVGMGVTGFVLKDLAAIFGPFGYTFKGVHKELVKHKQPTALIHKARQFQGQEDLKNCSEEQKKQNYETVRHGWSVVQQVWSAMEETREHGGIGGRFQVMKEKKHWRENGAFENIEMAEKALAARRNGESLEEIFAEQRAKIDEEANKPRKPVVEDIEEAKQEKVPYGKQDDAKQEDDKDRKKGAEADKKSTSKGRASGEENERKRMSWGGRKSLDKKRRNASSPPAEEDQALSKAEKEKNREIEETNKGLQQERRDNADLTNVMLKANGISGEGNTTNGKVDMTAA